MKRCLSCDAELNDSVKFCGYCGGSEFSAEGKEELPTPAVAAEEIVSMPPVSEVIPPVAPVVETVQPIITMAPANPVPVKEPKRVSGFAKFCSGVCGFLLTITLIVLSLILLLRFSLSEDAISSVGDNLEGKVADIEIGFLSESIDDGDTLADYLFDKTLRVRKQYSSYVNEDINDEVRESIEEVLNASFLSDFLADTISDYVSFVLYDEGKGYIKVEDIIELIEDNRKKVERLADNEVSARFLVMVDDAVRSSGILEAMDFREVEDANEGLFTTVRFCFSGIVEVILAAIALLMIVIIFVLRKDRHKAFSKTGRAFVVTAVVDLLVVGGTVAGVIFLNKAYPFGTEIYNAVLSPIRMWGAAEAGVFVVVGIVFIIIGKIVKRKY